MKPKIVTEAERGTVVEAESRFVRLRGARENNLKNVDVDVPRDALVVFTGVSGSGKSSLAFGTLYAEAERRFLESVAPYARRLFQQMPAPRFDSISGLPPAIALEQQHGAGTSRSSVGSVTTLSNLLRMLYSRVGDSPRGQAPLAAEAFSPNTAEGACAGCQGVGRVYDATEDSMVPDPNLTLRERAIASWPTAWHGQNQRDIVVSLGFDIDKPWHRLTKKQRDWLLFTDEQPVVPVYAGFEAEEVKLAKKRKEEPSYQGTFTGARRYLLHTFATTESPHVKRRVARYLVHGACPVCHGKRLRPEALAVRFRGLDITESSGLSLEELRAFLENNTDSKKESAERREVTTRITTDMRARLDVLLELGLGYLSLDRSTPTLSPGELTRLRLGTQVHSNLFGVVYVLDEPSAGLHPADTHALLKTLTRLRQAGNSIFVVEHELDVIERADWIVDVGPGAGEHGGRVLYSGPLPGLAHITGSETARHVFSRRTTQRTPRTPRHFLELRDVTRNNLQHLDVDLPLGVLCVVTGVSGSGKSSLVGQALVELISARLGTTSADEEPTDANSVLEPLGGRLERGAEHVRRLVRVDQKPIGRTPRSNLATYTGLFDHVRALFAETPLARRRRYDAGRFSFNVKKGRCEACQGEGFVSVELLFLPSVFAPCSTCGGKRYNPQTLEVLYRERSIADVLDLTVDRARDFFSDHATLRRHLDVLHDVGVGYLKLGQPATELSGGEAQRIKLSSELARSSRDQTLYVLDEPTTGLHPTDVEKLIAQFQSLVDAGHSLVVVEHDLQVVAASDYVIDLGPGAGARGGRIVARGTPSEVARSRATSGSTAHHLARALAHGDA